MQPISDDTKSSRRCRQVRTVPYQHDTAQVSTVESHCRIWG